MKPGTVFKWNNFPYPRFGGEIKPRWFVYLGDTGLLMGSIIAYFCTTTTMKDDFESGGRRARHRFILLQKSRYACFEQDCLLDFDERPFTEAEDTITSHKDIEVKGYLDNETLKLIYKGIFRSPHYSSVILADIHRSLNQIGITGLQKR